MNVRANERDRAIAIMTVRGFGAVLATCLLGACALQIAPVPPLIPPAPAAPVSTSTQALSIVTANPHQTHELLGVVERSPGRTTLVVMSLLGVRLFTVVQTGAEVAVAKHPALPEFVDPIRILTEVQFVNWSLDELNDGLAPPWSVEQDGATRRLLHDGRQVATAVYGRTPAGERLIELTTSIADYRLRVRVLADDPAWPDDVSGTAGAA